MHELAVTESIIEIVSRHAAEAGARKVSAINLVIGDLSSIVDDSVQFYFDYLSRDTIAAGAELTPEHLRAVLHAPDGWPEVDIAAGVAAARDFRSPVLA